MIKSRAKVANHDPALFSEHCLRAGFLTQAGRQGANPFRLKDRSRHKRLKFVITHAWEEEPFRDRARDGLL